MTEGYDLAEVLRGVDCSACSYEEWLQAGQALHAEGYPLEAWERWSRGDARYHEGECARKWAGFGAERGIGGGTLVQMARSHGWQQQAAPSAALSWDMDSAEEGRILDPSWVEDAELHEPGASWFGWRDTVRYLRALFDDGDTVGYCMEAFQREDGGKWLPANKGIYGRTAGDIIAALERYGGDFDSAMGRYEADAGAWVRLNPLTGGGVRNDDVAEFRYALVESDELPIPRQKALIDELNLPCAAVVHSGGKSLHAIVRIDARDYREYRERVDELYRVCERNGLALDKQNKNPSRLTRLPGVMRAGRRQWLVSDGCGAASWAAWREWLAEQEDDLPDPETLADIMAAGLPELAPPLIDGVLRRGHKMLLSGPSKAGKSFALIELCAAIASGTEWLGFRCAKGRVLYVNLEVDRASCLHRFADVWAAMGLPAADMANVDAWNLRGSAKPMDRLAPALIRRAAKTRPAAVVIDPIYKVITGDESSADQMAAFCNAFDMITKEVGCAVIYCHHHSKGMQGQKRSIDRASGSGVFARDPDALLDMLELAVSPEQRRAMEQAVQTLPAEERHAAWQTAHRQTAWRIEGTLREFPAFDPVFAWFRWPVHVLDDTGMLDEDTKAADDPSRTRKDWGLESEALLRAIAAADKREGGWALMSECGDWSIADVKKMRGIEYEQDTKGTHGGKKRWWVRAAAQLPEGAAEGF